MVVLLEIRRRQILLFIIIYFMAQCHRGRVKRFRFSFVLDDLSIFHRFEVKQESDDEEGRMMRIAVCRRSLP